MGLGRHRAADPDPRLVGADPGTSEADRHPPDRGPPDPRSDRTPAADDAGIPRFRGRHRAAEAGLRTVAQGRRAGGPLGSII